MMHSVKPASITIERKAKVDSRGLPIDGRHDNPVYSFYAAK
jgi:hypothetical protein